MKPSFSIETYLCVPTATDALVLSPVQAVYDRSTLHHTIVARPAMLSRLASQMRSSTDELSLIASPASVEMSSYHGTAGEFKSGACVTLRAAIMFTEEGGGGRVRRCSDHHRWRFYPYAFFVGQLPISPPRPSPLAPRCSPQRPADEHARAVRRVRRLPPLAGALRLARGRHRGAAAHDRRGADGGGPLLRRHVLAQGVHGAWGWCNGVQTMHARVVSSRFGGRRRRAFCPRTKNRSLAVASAV